MAKLILKRTHRRHVHRVQLGGADALAFEKALKAGGYGASAPSSPREPAPQASTKAPRVDAVTTRIIQELLREKGYTEVGPADGSAGKLTAAAIMAFQRENALEPTGEITAELQKQLADASVRKLARADTTREEIRSTVPEVRTNWLTRMGALVLGAPAAAFGLADGVLGKIDTARGYIAPLQEMFADIPGYV